MLCSAERTKFDWQRPRGFQVVPYQDIGQTKPSRFHPNIHKTRCHLERKKYNIPSISHSFCTSRRKQFHLKRLVVASAVEQPEQQPVADWLIRSQRVGPLLLPLARSQPRGCVYPPRAHPASHSSNRLPANVCRRDECAKMARADDECFLFKSWKF